MRSEPSSSSSRTARSLTIFALSYGFYLALGRATDPFDLVTGALSAGVVAVAFSGVAFRESPAPRRTGGRLLRGVAFLPYLLWEVLKANLALAVVVLHPRLPISPEVVRVETDADSDLERTMLASAITLTPGTVALDVDDDALYVHALTSASRDALLTGGLGRAVGFVFRESEDSNTTDSDDTGRRG